MRLLDMLHKHHIIPKHMGGTDDPSNLVELTIEEHAEAHYKLWLEYGCVEDKMAWKALSGRKLTEEDRIELASSGRKKFLQNEEKVQEWKSKISKTLTGKKQSDYTISKRAETLRELWESGQIQREYTDDYKEKMRENYITNNMRDKLSEGRRNSEKWKQSVTSDEYRLKKTQADPRSRKVSVNGKIYDSIRQASRLSGIQYNKLRVILLENTDDDIFFC